MTPSRDNRRRISERAQENLLAVAFLAIFLTAIVMGLTTLTARALIVPLPVTIAGCVFVIAQLLAQNRRRSGTNQAGSVERDGSGDRAVSEPTLATTQEGPAPGSGAAPDAAGQAEVARTGGSPWTAILLVLAFLVLILAVGILPAIAVYVAGYLALVAKLSVRAAVLATLAMTGGIYALFVLVLEVRLWSGYFLPPLF